MQLVILGAGPGGYVAALRAAQLGLEVTLVEREAAPGGTCLHRGCIPTKFLLEAAHALEEYRRLLQEGILYSEGCVLDCAQLQKKKRELVRRLSLGIEGLLKKGRVRFVRGEGRLSSAHTLRVGEEEIPFTNLILATGSWAALPAPFRPSAKIWTSDEALERAEPAPAKLIVVGSGAVGVELASYFGSLGSEITLIEQAPRLLPGEDEEISAAMERILKKRGWHLEVGQKVSGLEETEIGVEVSLEGREEKLSANAVLMAVGRKPNLENLGLEEVGVALTPQGRIEVDPWGRTSCPHIYAIGDIVPGPQLAHLASAEGIAAVEHLAGLEPAPAGQHPCPAATYSFPPVASVGLTETQAREKGYELKVGRFPLAALGRAQLAGAGEGLAKIVAQADTGQILGVHLLGAGACELIGEAAVAVSCRLTLKDLVESIHPHPSYCEALWESALHACGRPLSFSPPPERRGRR